MVPCTAVEGSTAARWSHLGSFTNTAPWASHPLKPDSVGPGFIFVSRAFFSSSAGDYNMQQSLRTTGLKKEEEETSRGQTSLVVFPSSIRGDQNGRVFYIALFMN